MRRQAPPQFPQVSNRTRTGVQYYCHPGPLARDLWSYALGIGTARCPRNYHAETPGYRMGYLFHYVRDGELEQTVGGRTFKVGKGSVCLLDYSRGNDLRNSA